jgi:hypothetical protein
MIFEDRESANAANDKVLEFVQASLLDLRAPRTMTILSLDLPPLWRDARFHC